MNKTLLTTAFAAVSLSLSAQTVMTDPGLGGLIGTIMTLKIVSNSPASLAMTGSNINWDLSAATFTPVASLSFVDPSTTPYGAQFPAANLGTVTTDASGTTYDYTLHTTTSLENIAEQVNSSSPRIFSNYKTTNIFPLNYNDTFTDTYQETTGTLQNNVRTYDAWGMMTVPGHTYTNVGRISFDNLSHATWFNTSPFFPLLVYDGSNLIYFDPVAIAGIKQNPSPASFSIFPNPSADIIVISLHTPGHSTAIITDATGKTVDSFSLNDTYTYQSAQLAAGMYFCTVTTPTGISSSRFVKK